MFKKAFVWEFVKAIKKSHLHKKNKNEFINNSKWFTIGEMQIILSTLHLTK